MSPLTTILTFTYNKPRFFREAAQSILGQSSGDWRWWVVLDGANEETTDIAHDLARQDARIVLFTETVEDRYAVYRPAMLANKYVPMVSTRYICSHGDDDLKEPCFLEALVGALESNPGYHVAYGVCRTFLQSGEEWIQQKTLPDDRSWKFGPGSAICPDCRLNDGQILQTKAAWNILGWRLPTGYGKATHIDGVYLDHLARHFDFLFVDVNVHRVRHTYLSENVRGSATREPEESPAVPFQPDRAEGDSPGNPPSYCPGYVNQAWIDGSLGFLFLEGWLLGACPQVRGVWLRNAFGEEVAAQFQYRWRDAPDLRERLVGLMPEGQAPV